jgi:hypothetical protein
LRGNDGWYRFSLLEERRVNPRYFFTAALVVLGIMLALTAWSLPLVMNNRDAAFVFYLIAAIGVLVLLAAVLLLRFPTWRLSGW